MLRDTTGLLGGHAEKRVEDAGLKLGLTAQPFHPTPARAGRMDDTSSCRPLFLYFMIESQCLLLAWSFEPHRGYTRLGGHRTPKPENYYLPRSTPTTSGGRGSV